MRENRNFAQRSHASRSKEALRKYFLIYEGAATEDIYFAAVKRMRKEIGLNPLIELVPLLRSYSEEGWSNPKKLVDRIIANLHERDCQRLSYESLLNKFMEYFYSIGILTTSKVMAKAVWLQMEAACREVLHKEGFQEVVNLEEDSRQILKYLQEKQTIGAIVVDIADIIANSEITYAEGLDRICLIVDRDRESFLAVEGNNQYQYVVDKCAENNFIFCVTNPCFEFWLLLHFDAVFSLDGEKLLLNPKVTSKRRYTEQALRNIVPNYTKSRFDAEKLVSDIDKAIANEKHFCEDLQELEGNIGSNLGMLITEMRKR